MGQYSSDGFSIKIEIQLSNLNLGVLRRILTPGARDGRIRVNDQILEVDGESLVGVTQSWAAAVLRNTRGPVKFVIGRDRDPYNSEVAHLIHLATTHVSRVNE